MKNNKDYIKNLTLLSGNDTLYPDKPSFEILETFDNRFSDRDYWITFKCPEFTTRCPVTNQPDFGIITVSYIADLKCLESKSMKLYLFAYRNFNTFHEGAVNMILDDLVKACFPRKMTIKGDFNARGGISISVSTDYQKN